MLSSRSWRDVGLAAEDQLDAVRLGLGVEVDRAEHVAVIGDRDGVHPELLHLGEQVLHADRAVEQAVLRVQMEVGELGHDSRAPGVVASLPSARRSRRASDVSERVERDSRGPRWRMASAAASP